MKHIEVTEAAMRRASQGDDADNGAGVAPEVTRPLLAWKGNPTRSNIIEKQVTAMMLGHLDESMSHATAQAENELHAEILAKLISALNSQSMTAMRSPALQRSSSWKRTSRRAWMRSSCQLAIPAHPTHHR